MTPPLHSMEGFAKCEQYKDNPETCFTFGYAVIGNEDNSPWIEYAL